MQYASLFMASYLNLRNLHGNCYCTQVADEEGGMTAGSRAEICLSQTELPTAPTIPGNSCAHPALQLQLAHWRFAHAPLLFTLAAQLLLQATGGHLGWVLCWVTPCLPRSLSSKSSDTSQHVLPFPVLGKFLASFSAHSEALCKGHFRGLDISLGNVSPPQIPMRVDKHISFVGSGHMEGLVNLP